MTTRRKTLLNQESCIQGNLESLLHDEAWHDIVPSVGLSRSLHTTNNIPVTTPPSVNLKKNIQLKNWKRWHSVTVGALNESKRVSAPKTLPPKKINLIKKKETRRPPSLKTPQVRVNIRKTNRDDNLKTPNGVPRTSGRQCETKLNLEGRRIWKTQDNTTF